MWYWRVPWGPHLFAAAAVALVSKANSAACAESAVGVALAGEAERGGPGGVVDVLTAGGVGCFRGSAVAVDLVIFGGVRLGSNTQDQVYVSV